MKRNILIGGLSVVFVLLQTSVSLADDESSNIDYCNKVRARANSDAALLYAPSIQAQLIKFPGTSSGLDLLTTGSTTASGLQARGLVTWSPLDFIKGFSVANLAEADCQQHRAMVDAMNVIVSVTDVGRLPALKAQVDYLRSQQPKWHGILEATDERLKANVITQDDAMKARDKILLLDRKLTEMQGQANNIAAKELPETQKDTAALIKAVDLASMKFERKSNYIRSFDAWQTGVSFGIVPPLGTSSVEWFGVVSVGFNFGAFTHNAQDNKYLDARKAELHNARYEMREQLIKFRQQISATMSASIQEISILEAEEMRLSALHDAIAKTNADATMALLDAIELERIDLESDRIFLEEFRNQLSQWK
jgi:hypothetical protein